MHLKVSNLVKFYNKKDPLIESLNFTRILEKLITQKLIEYNLMFNGAKILI